LEAETLSWVAVTAYCFRKKDSPWVREVNNPNGFIVGGLFYPDVLGSGLVTNTHRFGLERSATYAGLYRELLTILDKKFGRNDSGSEGASASDIKAELSGTYVLPAPPQLKQPDPTLQPKSKPTVQAQLPSASEILEQGRIKLLERTRLRVPAANLSPDAGRFLGGSP
jgi:hypothetical protein